MTSSPIFITAPLLPAETNSIGGRGAVRAFKACPECTDGTKTGEFSNGTFGEFTSGTHIMCCFSAPAYSAGAKPATRVNVSAIAVLDELGNPTSEFRTKDWNDFSGDARAKMDFVITLCDAAAGEICPVWLGRPLAAHWGIPDPAAVRGTEAEKRTAFLQCYRQLSARITTFVNLDLAKLAKPALRARLAAIGAMEGATEKALGTEVN